MDFLTDLWWMIRVFRTRFGLGPKNNDENIVRSTVDVLTDITEQNREKDQTMSSTEGDNADEHSKVKDMKELRVWEAKDDNTTDFRQSDTAEDL
jgi:hypothetical protein